MIKKILKDKQDVESLSGRPVSQATAEKFDYRNVVVNKPWGYEYLMFENEHVAVWILFLKSSTKTSMHCHPKKRTSLLVLEGEVQTASLCENFKLKTLDCLIIDSGVFHSTGTDFPTGAFIMEIETPPEKTDLVRLADAYGRENKGYESGDEITEDTTAYEHCSFHGDDASKRQRIERVIRQSRIILHTREDWASLREEVEANQFCVLSFLDTLIVDEEGAVVLAVGEMCERDWFLEKYNELHPSRDSFTVLSIH